MLVNIERKVFSALDDSGLGWACIEPTLLKIRGKNSAIKTQVYSELTKGQQALLMFRILYDHAKNSKTEFNAWMPVLVDQPHTWSEIKAGLTYFKADAMLQFINIVEDVLKKSIDMEEQYYLDFGRIAQETVHLIGAYIRDNPEEFANITD